MTDFVAETTDATAASAATTTPAAPEITVTTAPKHKPIFFSRFTMRAPLVVGGQARPDIESLMMFGIYRENPRITVKTNDPGDEQNSYGKITGAMDPVTWGVLMQHIKDLIKNPVKDIKVIDNLNNYKGGQKFDEPQHINRTLVGRDDDGRIWIKLLEEGRPSPTFYFGPPKYHNLIRMDKTPVPAGEASQLYAQAVVKMLTEVMTTSMGKRDDGEEDTAAANAQAAQRPAGQGVWQGRQGGGGGGGWQGRQGGGGGGWQGRQGGGGGGWQNRQGGGGGGQWQNRGGNGGGGGQGGGWQNRQGGGGQGQWQNRQGGGAGGGGQAPAPAVTNDEITF